MRSRFIQICRAVAGALLITAAWAAPSSAQIDYCKRVGPLVELDRQSQMWRSEVENQNKTIADMQRLLDESMKSGGKPPDIKRLVPMGQAGTGVVGVGKTKPVDVQKVINEYESLIEGDKKADDHLGDVGLQKSVLLRERAREVARRKKELNLPADKLLSKQEMRRIKEMALGRAIFLTEIKRSKEIREKFQKRFAELNKKRMAQWSKLKLLERAKYQNKECAKDAAAPDTANGNGRKAPGKKIAKPMGPLRTPKISRKPEPAAKAPDNADKIKGLVAELEALFAQWDAKLRAIEIAAREFESCDGIASAVKIRTDARFIKRRNGEVDAALAAEEQRLAQMKGQLNNLAGNTAKISAKIGEAADAACRAAHDDSLDAAASAEQSKRSGRIKKLLDQLAYRATTQARSLASGATSGSSDGEIANLQADAAAVAAACTAAEKFVAPFSDDDPAKEPKVSQLIVEAFKLQGKIEQKLGALKQAEKSGAGRAAEFDIRFALNRSATNSVTKSGSSCLKRARNAKAACKEAVSGAALQGEIDKLKQRAQKLAQARQLLAAEAKRIAADIEAMAKAAAGETSRAGDCVREAEAKEAAKTKSAGGGPGKGTPPTKPSPTKSSTGMAPAPPGGAKATAAKSAACADLQKKYDAALNKAEGQYAAGEFTDTIATLKGAKATVARLNGTPPCIADTTRLDTGIAKAQKLDDAFGKIDAAIASCNAGKMASYSKQMSRLSDPHPLMAAKIADLNRVRQAVARPNAAYAKAQALYARGDIGQAKTKLREAKTALAALKGKPACGALDRKLDTGIARIDRLNTALGRAEAAIQACDIHQMEAWRLKFLEGPSHPLMRKKIQVLEQAKKRCQTVVANKSCRKEFGVHSRARMDQSDYKTYVCICQKGYQWNEGKTQCLDAQAIRDRIAAANTYCQEKSGSGYRAGKIQSDGSYYCIPSKQTASAWCKANNQGSGWAARNIKADGTFNCRLTKAGRNANCSSQYGRGWYAGKVQRDGSYKCNMGKSARNATCRQQFGGGWYAGKVRRDGSFLCHGPRGPSGGPSGAEVGAAIAGAVIQGIIESQGGGGGGSPSNCHRRPDGTIHCGSN